jgi:hypothetical protein
MSLQNPELAKIYCETTPMREAEELQKERVVSNYMLGLLINACLFDSLTDPILLTSNE